MQRKKNPSLRLTLRQLQIFAAVARAESTTAAAKEIALIVVEPGTSPVARRLAAR